MLVYEQLPDSNPVKKVAAEYIAKYEQKFGTRSTFGGTPTTRTCSSTKAIPVALKKGKPAPRNSARRCATRWRPRPWWRPMACS